MKGIYSITNKLNSHRYIGSSINVSRRKKEHFTLLKTNKHHSQYLQNAWNKYGEDMFIFSILENVEDNNLLIPKEQWWLTNTPCEYNISKVAGNKGIGEENKDSKICFQYSLDGVFLKKWMCISDVERELNFDTSLIVRCLKEKTRTAFKFRWFYEFQGTKIEAIKVKSCKNNTRNPEVLEKFKELFKLYPDKSFTFFAKELNVSLTFIRNMFQKHRLLIQGHTGRKLVENTEKLQEHRRLAQQKALQIRINNKHMQN